MIPAIGGEQVAKAWAYRIRAKYLRGERLSRIQIEFASSALGEVWSGGKCTKAESQ